MATALPGATGGSHDTDPKAADRRVVAWLLVLAALTGAGVVLTYAAGAGPGEEFPPAVLLVAFAPTLAALCVAAFSPRLRGVWELLRKVGTWRADWRWYALVLLAPVVLVVSTNLIYTASGNPPPPHWVAVPSAAAVGAAAGPWLSGMIEEIAWRGFAQPLLQVRYSALWASIVVGVLWATWHEWPLLTPGGLADFSPPLVLHTYIRLIATAILYAWLYNTTGSLLLVMVAHLAHNAAIDLVPIPAQAGGDWALILASLYLALTLAVVWATNTKTLTRSRHD